MDRSLVLVVSVSSKTNQISQIKKQRIKTEDQETEYLFNYPGFASDVHSRSTDPVHSKFIRKLTNPEDDKKENIKKETCFMMYTTSNSVNRVHRETLKTITDQ